MTTDTLFGLMKRADIGTETITKWRTAIEGYCADLAFASPGLIWVNKNWRKRIAAAEHIIKAHAPRLDFSGAELDLLTFMAIADLLSLFVEEERLERGDETTSVWNHGRDSSTLLRTFFEDEGIAPTELTEFLLLVMEQHTSFEGDPNIFHGLPVAQNIAKLLWDLDTLTELDRTLCLLGNGKDPDFEREQQRIWQAQRKGRPHWGKKERRISPAYLLDDFHLRIVSPAECISFEAYLLALLGRVMQMEYRLLVQECASTDRTLNRLARHLLARGRLPHRDDHYRLQGTLLDWKAGLVLQETSHVPCP